jgi:AraC family transcriptional regulator of adaptative response / DNA-3-methyladenine glycosylase II
MELDRDICYRALVTRDARFDGRFYTGVTSTGIYCRPVCPARTPKLEHCRFLPSAAAAHRAGFRPCLRCRPEIAPGLAGWRGTEQTVSRALGMIAEGALDDDGDLESLAARLGVGSRHLRRLFEQYVGAPPIAVAQAQRILFAKKLIDETSMSMAQVAFTAGFGSIRRFNDAMRRTYGRAPGDLRRARSGARDRVGITLEIPFVPPYDWSALVGFLAPRAIPGVESVAEDRYLRTVTIGEAVGRLEVRPAETGDHLRVTLDLSDLSSLPAAVARVRRLFDVDADITTIEEHLARDPRLAPLVGARPGVRVPGAWDPFELMVRAILGQQVSVAAATTLAGRLAARYGTPLPSANAGEDVPCLLFPAPEQLRDLDPAAIGLPAGRAAAIGALASAVIDDPSLLRPYEPVETVVAKLCALPGIGAWTASYIAMRALREPDAFPATDLGLRRALEVDGVRPSATELAAAAEAWRPWRSYAAMHLWLASATASTSKDLSS